MDLNSGDLNICKIERIQLSDSVSIFYVWITNNQNNLGVSVLVFNVNLSFAIMLKLDLLFYTLKYAVFFLLYYCGMSLPVWLFNKCLFSLFNYQGTKLQS